LPNNPLHRTLDSAGEQERSASNGRLSWSEQASNILSQYQAILDIATPLSLNKLFDTSSTGVERRYTSNSGHWQNSV
jgi:hypothetical protein